MERRNMTIKFSGLSDQLSLMLFLNHVWTLNSSFRLLRVSDRTGLRD